MEKRIKGIITAIQQRNKRQNEKGGYKSKRITNMEKRIKRENIILPNSDEEFDIETLDKAELIKKAKQIDPNFKFSDEILKQIHENYDAKILKNQSTTVVINSLLFQGNEYIVRTALSLSTLFITPTTITNIRMFRTHPGINHSLLECVMLMRQIGNVRKSGTKKLPPKIKDTKFNFIPRDIISGHHNYKCNKPASVFPVIQMAIPPLLFSQGHSSLNVNGITDVQQMASSLHIKTFCKDLLSKMGITVEYNILKRGYWQCEDGEIYIKTQEQKARIKALNFSGIKSKIHTIYIELITKNDFEKKLSQDFIKQAQQKIINLIKIQFPDTCKENVELISTIENFNKVSKNEKQKQKAVRKYKNMTPVPIFPDFYGISVILVGDNVFYSCNSFKEKITPDDQLHIVIMKIRQYLAGPAHVDDQTQDQLLVYMLLAEGVSLLQVSHNITNQTKQILYLIEQFIDGFKYSINQDTDKEGINFNIIRIEGMALKIEDQLPIFDFRIVTKDEIVKTKNYKMESVKKIRIPDRNSKKEMKLENQDRNIQKFQNEESVGLNIVDIKRIVNNKEEINKKNKNILLNKGKDMINLKQENLNKIIKKDEKKIQEELQRDKKPQKEEYEKIDMSTSKNQTQNNKKEILQKESNIQNKEKFKIQNTQKIYEEDNIKKDIKQKKQIKDKEVKIKNNKK